MLQLILGRAGSGKTTELYRRIGQVAEAGGQAILLVPEQFSFENERELYLRSGITAVWRDGRWTIQPGASSWG